MAHGKQKVLIVDDEPAICNLLSHLAEKEGFLPVTAASAEEALSKISTENPDIVLTDIMMPEMSGIDLLKRVRAICSDLPVVIITGYAQIPGAVEAIKLGANDYLPKPFDHGDVIRVVKCALKDRQLKQKARLLHSNLELDSPIRKSMGPSEVVDQLISEINLVAQSNFSVILFGETGTGKELVARAIHEASGRSDKAFIAVDCGAIPESLFESELFGHKKGAFTGAAENKVGKFEAAHGGTQFLDEISNMPLGSQSKLLRTLQEKSICPLGSNKIVKVDVRIIAASNQNLRELTATGLFREDLFFRLGEYILKVPPLRERKNDIPYLAKLFLDRTNQELSKNVQGFTEEAMEILLSYDWPGNVREFRSIVRRGVLLADKLITKKQLAIKRSVIARLKLASKLPTEKWEGKPLKESVRKLTQEIEREILTQVINQTKGNKAEAARLLKIDYKTILSKLKEYSILPDGEQNDREEYTKKDEQGGGFEGMLKGFSDILEKLGDLAETGDRLARTGEVEFGKDKQFKGVYGFSVKVGAGGEGVKVEPFGNIKKDKKTGKSVVQEIREPLIDVFEEPDHVLIVAEMPGIEAEDIRIEISDDILTLSAEKKDKKYSKEIHLPGIFSQDKTTVSCKNGVAEIRCGK